MAHIGILCPTLTGHLNPMIAIGRELQRRSHRVTVVGFMDGKAKIVAAGLDFLAIGTGQFPVGSTRESLKTLGELNGLAALTYSLKLVEQATKVLLEESPKALTAAGIDFLLVDQSLYSGSTIAQVMDLPFVTVCCALMLNPEPDVPPFFTPWRYRPKAWARLRNRGGYQLLARLARGQIQQIIHYRQRQKLPPLDYEHDTYSTLAQICQQPAEFEFPRQSLPACFHFVGPCIDSSGREPAEFPFDQLTGQSLVYASLGTLQNRMLWMFDVIAAACENIDVQLVIALGGGISPTALPPLSGSPLVVGYAPQVELLQRATLAITHAGMNTVLESLSNGVPMVAIPITNDQPGVAARITWTGSGDVIAPRSLTVAKLHRKICKVLTQPSYQDNAIRLQKSIQTTGGSQQAADIIEKAISTNKSILSSRDPFERQRAFNR